MPRTGAINDPTDNQAQDRSDRVSGAQHIPARGDIGWDVPVGSEAEGRGCRAAARLALHPRRIAPRPPPPLTRSAAATPPRQPASAHPPSPSTPPILQAALH